MTQTFKANGVSLGTSAVRLGSIQGFTTMAELGAVGMSQVVIDNPGGTVTIPAWKLFTDDESAEASGNQRVHTAYITQRRYKRRVGSSLIVGADNEIEVDLSDLNELLNFHLITGLDGNRPSETITARITWILASTYLSGLVFDNGFVASSSYVMDAVDYTGQNPANVIGDCALAVKFNFFVYYDESAGQASLWFSLPTSTNWDSGIYLSNVLGDIDQAAIEAGTATVFYVLNDAEMTSDPTRCYSGVYLPYQKGHVYVTNATIESNFTGRDGSAPNSNVKTLAAATVVANNFLTDNETEDVRITCTYQPRDIQVNAILAGQLVNAKFSHFAPYTAYSTFRVLQRSVAQSIEDDTRYQVQLVLSPTVAPDLVTTWGIFGRHNTDNNVYDYKGGYPSRWRIPWVYNGNFPGSGWTHPTDYPLVGLIEYQSWDADTSSPGSPQGGPYTTGGGIGGNVSNMGSGFKVLGTGIVDVFYQWTLSEVDPPGATVGIMVNGVSVASVPSGTGLAPSGTVSILGLSVVTNDVIECYAEHPSHNFGLASFGINGTYFYVSGYLA